MEIEKNFEDHDEVDVASLVLLLMTDFGWHSGQTNGNLGDAEILEES